MARINNPAGAFGYTSLSDKVEGLTANFTSAETATTISRGDAVSVDTSGKILQSTTSVDVNLVIGVAAENIAPGESGAIVILGPAYAKLAAGTAVGATLARSGAAAGTLLTATAGATNGCTAVCIQAESGGYGYVWFGHAGAAN
jgi:hypothetical protein